MHTGPNAIGSLLTADGHRERLNFRTMNRDANSTAYPSSLSVDSADSSPFGVQEQL